MFTGYIDRIRDGEVVGWIVGGSRHVVPLVLVDGVPTQNLATDVPRADVSQALQLSANCGFRSRILTRVHGKAAHSGAFDRLFRRHPVGHSEVSGHRIASPLSLVSSCQPRTCSSMFKMASGPVVLRSEGPSSSSR